MLDDLCDVTLTCRPVRAVSQVSSAGNYELDFWVVMRVQIEGGHSLRVKRLRPDGYSFTARPPTDQTYRLPRYLADNLTQMVQEFFVKKRGVCDGFQFVDYVMGATVSLHEPATAPIQYQGDVNGSQSLSPGQPYMIAGPDGQLIHPVIGLSGPLCLSVNGAGGPLAVCHIQTLNQAYAGSGVFWIGQIQPD